MSATSKDLLQENPSDLSENEARVLHSLVKWPNLNDQDIHTRISMKKSTFSSIKSRLLDQNYFKRYYVPNPSALGFELLCSMHGNLNRFSTLEERMRVAGDTIQSFVEDFYVISESNKAFNLSIAQNFTEYAKNQQEFYQLYASNKFLTRKGMVSKTYPFSFSRIRAFMDFEAMLSNLFGYSSDPYGNNFSIPTGTKNQVSLSNAEQKVLLGLIKYPDESDTYIADEVSVSRNTVANAKTKFEKEQVCFPKVVPNLEQLGMKLLVFEYRQFNPTTTMGQREQAAELVREHLAPFFYVSKNLDGFIISAHKSFEDYNRSRDEVVRYYLKHDYISKEPDTLHISIPNMHTLKDFDLLPITMKILGFDPSIPIADQA